MFYGESIVHKRNRGRLGGGSESMVGPKSWIKFT